MMLFVAVLLFAVALWLLLISLELVRVSNKTVRTRLQGAARPRPGEEGTRAPRRVLIANAELGNSRFFSPTVLVTLNERNLLLAGRPEGWTLKRLLFAKLLLTSIVAPVALLLFVAHPGAKFAVACIFLVTMAYFLPDLLIHGRATDRQKAIELALPDVLDQATIAIESGLSFEASISRVGNASKGPLADEIVRTVQDMRLGMTRREAYTAMAARSSVSDLKRFTKSIVQAEEFGVPVANVVRNMAKEMRTKRRFRAEAAALQIPVKMLFPLMVCIFPVLFVVVLYPVISNIGATLAQH